MELFQRSVCKGLVFGGELQCNGDWGSDLKCLARELCQDIDIEGYTPGIPSHLVVFVEVPYVS